jgi:hypothetical protein
MTEPPQWRDLIFLRQFVQEIGRRAFPDWTGTEATVEEQVVLLPELAAAKPYHRRDATELLLKHTDLLARPNPQPSTDELFKHRPDFWPIAQRLAENLAKKAAPAVHRLHSVRNQIIWLSCAGELTLWICRVLGGPLKEFDPVCWNRNRPEEVFNSCSIDLDDRFGSRLNKYWIFAPYKGVDQVVARLTAPSGVTHLKAGQTEPTSAASGPVESAAESLAALPSEKADTAGTATGDAASATDTEKTPAPTPAAEAASKLGASPSGAQSDESAVQALAQEAADSSPAAKQPLNQVSDDAQALSAADRLELDARREKERANREKENDYRRGLRRKKAAFGGYPSDIHRTSDGCPPDAPHSRAEAELGDQLPAPGGASAARSLDGDRPVAEAPGGAESLADVSEVNRGGRPSDRDLLVGEAVRRLKENVPRQLAPFARQIHEWLRNQPDASKDSKGEVARVETVQDHIRDVFRVATEAEQRLKAGKAIPSTLAAFAGELRTSLEEWPDAYRSKKTGEVMSVGTIEELVRDRFNKFWSR